MKKIWIGIGLAGVLTGFGAPSTLTEKGEPKAEIIVDLHASAPVKLAARELQNQIRMITDARIPILNGELGRKNIPVFLGTLDSPLIAPALKKFPLDADALRGNDGYAVRAVGGKLYLYASEPRGVLNGVHRLMMRNTDWVWVRPYRELAVYSKVPTLTLKENHYVDIPKFVMRGWGANRSVALRSEEFELFVSRLGCNFTTSLNPAAHERRLEHAFELEFGGGHNIGNIWLPIKEYGKKHPEFYMLVNGERRTATRLTHPCFSNPEMKKEFIANTLKIVENLPAYYKRINIMIEDTPAVCECAECEKPITLPGGKKLTKEHEAFRSTAFFLFLNDVARTVYEKNPKLQIKTFGYFFTAIPPEVKLFPSICVSFCPYVRNDKETLQGKSNAKWLERTKRWARMTPRVIWREYYYSQAAFPRAQANVVAPDLRFINRLGVKMIYPELTWGDRPGSVAQECPENEFFDMNAPEFWVINQLFWNPESDPDALRSEFIRRAYREGAPGVEQFFRLLRDSWLNDPTPSAFNDDYRRSTGRYVVDKKLTVPCRAALDKAAEEVRDPRSKALIGQLRETFEKWLKSAVAGKVSEQPVPKAEIRSFPGFDFDSGVWKKASVLPPMRKMGRRLVEPPEPTDVHLIHNNETLYVGFRSPFPGRAVAKTNLKHDQWPAGDHAEIFIGHPTEGYYHFAFDCNGNRYEARGTDPEWNAPWEVRTEQRDGEWRAVAAIPLKSVGAAIERNNRVKALFYRCRPSRGREANVHSSWGGGNVHSAESFGELVFALE